MGLTKLGPNGMILTASNTYSGPTTISGGTLQLGDGAGGHVGSVGGIYDYANLVFNLAGTQTYGGSISGSGNLTVIGGGTLTLNAANPFTGSTSVNGGTLVLANSNALQGSTLATNSVIFSSGVTSNAFTFGGLSGSGNTTLRNNASAPIALTVGGNGANTAYSGILSGSGGSLTKAGASKLILTGSNTYTGPTTISGGTLQLGDGSAGHDGSLASTAVVTNAAQPTTSSVRRPTPASLAAPAT